MSYGPACFRARLKCADCGLVFSSSNPRAGGGRASRCRDCYNSYKRKYAILQKPLVNRLARGSYKRCKVRNKALIYAAYGNKCACCGETEPLFMTIDHVKGDGKEHRKLRNNVANMYRDVVKEGFPKDRYQLLCFNCNQAKGRHGECPHETARRKQAIAAD